MYICAVILIRMKNSTKELIDSHKAKIERLISAYEYSQAEVISLREKLSVAEAEVLGYKAKSEESIRKIRELEEKITDMKISGFLVSNVEDGREAAGSIRKLVKEIDKCIAMLGE